MINFGFSQVTKEPLTLNSHIYSGNPVCEKKEVNTYYVGRTLPNKLISFDINPNDPEKILVLPDSGGTKKYQLVGRGSQCYTYADPARYSLYGFYLEYVPDPPARQPRHRLHLQTHQVRPSD